MSNKRHSAYLFLIASELLAGTIIVIIKPALTFVSSKELLFLRYLSVVPLAIPFLIVSLIQKQIPKRLIPKLILNEVAVAFTLWLLYTGLQTVSAIQASLLITIRPVFITIAGLLLLKEHEQHHEWIGLILATVGATLITTANGPINMIITLGTACILATNVIDALFTAFYKENLIQLPKIALNAFHVMVCFIVFTLANINSIPQVLHTASLHPIVIFSAVFSGIIGSVFASIFNIIGYAKIEISEATLFSYLKPLVYIPLSVIWLGESFNLTQIIGLIIVFVGVWYAESRHPEHWFSKILRKSHWQHSTNYHLHQ